MESAMLTEGTALTPSTTYKPHRKRRTATVGTTSAHRVSQPTGTSHSDDANRSAASTENGDVRDTCCFQGRYFWDALKAIAARQLFFFHALLAIWRIAAVSGNGRFWYLSLTFSFLLLETLIILFWKRGQEWKWFQPSVQCYLICVVPPIWLLELDHLGFIDLLHRPGNQTVHDRYEIFPFLRLDKQQWLLALEQSLLVLVILNRWIIPKGSLSRDGLSQLLLTHLGTACDIVDFYSILSEPSTRKRKAFCYIVLTIWTMSIHQFCIVSTAKRDTPGTEDHVSDSDSDLENPDEDVEDPAASEIGRTDSVGQLHRKVKIDNCAIAVPVAIGSDVEKKKRDRRRHRYNGGFGYRRVAGAVYELFVLLLETEAWSTILSLLMQDLPFFVIRITTIFVFQIVNYTNCFFAAKNLLVLILQCYRIYSVSVEHYHTKEDKKKERQDMWLVKVKFLDYPDPRRWRQDRATYSNRYFKF